MRRLRKWLKHARRRLWAAIKRRHDAKPGSAERKKWAETVRHRERVKDELVEKIERRNRKPDWNGHRPVLGNIGSRVVKEANSRGLVVTSTNDGQHSTGSYHYQNRAIDFGVDWSTGVSYAEAQRRLRGFQYWLAKEYPTAREVFGPEGFYIKNGVRYGGAFPNHGDHDHFAF